MDSKTKEMLFVLVEHLLRLNGKGGVRNEPEAFLRNQFSGHAAYSVCLVLYADKRSFKVLDKLVLTLGKSP